MRVICYPSRGKHKALKICEAFAAGCGGRVAPLGQTGLEKGAAFFYGWTEHTAKLIEACRREGRTWFYADNAYYFGRGTYFRVTRNALMHDGSGTAGSARFDRFYLPPRPWRKVGRHVLIATQSELFYRLHLNTSRKAWTDAVIDELRGYTAREIRVCHKPDSKDMRFGQPHAASFERQLKHAWALVTYSSSTAVKAILQGIPVFSLGPSMAPVVAARDLSSIERPFVPDEGVRLQWLWNLAANQWTREEMRDGTCWRDLRRTAADRGEALS